MIKPNLEHNPYYQSDIRDAIRTRKWLAGHDMSDEPKWIVREKNIPTAWYAISTLAPQNGSDACTDALHKASMTDIGTLSPA